MDEELVKFFPRHSTISIDIDDVEFLDQFIPHVVLKTCFFDPLVNRIRVSKTISNVLVVDHASLIR